jgi:hypothetical protein
MTYRVYGILGTASRNRKALEKDTADLIMVIAGLIAAALSKTYLSQNPQGPEKPVKTPPREVKEKLNTVIEAPAREVKEKPVTPEKIPEAPIRVKTPTAAPPAKPAKRPDGAFHSHARKMEGFRKAHH